jgi:microcystin-dependent protein
MPGGIAITPVLQVPIGGVAAWLKSYANTPALPSGWIECNGQTLNDPESPYNGQAIPNLNGGNRFLRGNSTSGNTGGSETVSLTAEQNGEHSHYLPTVNNGGGSTRLAIINFDNDDNPYTEIESEKSGSGSPHENLPPYYNVVWIMRVK